MSGFAYVLSSQVLGVIEEKGKLFGFTLSQNTLTFCEKLNFDARLLGDNWTQGLDKSLQNS